MRDVFPSSDGNQGLKGDRGQKGEQGIRGPPGRDPEPANTTESSGGTVYIRWGRDECPVSAQLVYHGKNVTHRGTGRRYSAFGLVGYVPRRLKTHTNVYRGNRVPKCDVIKLLFLQFSIFITIFQ